MDLAASGTGHELKAADALTRDYFSRFFYYPVCLSIKFIKLLKFLSMSEDDKHCVCPITLAIHHALRIDEQGFKPLTASCRQLRQQLHALVNDLGDYLEADLYDKALGSLTGVPELPLTVLRDGLGWGTHRMRSLAERVGFQVSAFSKCLSQHRTHLRRLLNTLPVACVHGINSHNKPLMLTTLSRSVAGPVQSPQPLA